MASEFSRSLLKVAVAQICQNIGWNAVQTSPLEVLVDIAHRYLVELSRTTHQYSNQYNRSEPNVVDLCLAFRLMGVQLHELEEYVNNVEPVPFAHQVAAFPLSHNSNFQFPKPKSRAVAQRPEWIHEHLPLTHPEQEGDEEPPPLTPEPSDGNKVFDIPDSPSSSSSEDLDLNSSSVGGIKRPNDGSMESHVKRTKIPFEDEGRPMRELVSIFMTPSGVISPACEGKLPEARIPAKNVESTSESADLISSSSSSSSSVSLPVDIAVPKPVKIIKKDKSKMLKFKKDMVLKKHMKKIKLPKNKSPSHRFPFDSPPPMVKREGAFPDDLKIKKRKKSSDMKLSKMKPINKIRIAKDKSFRSKDLVPPLPIMKSPKTKHRIKSPSHSSVGYPRSPKSPKGFKFHPISKHGHSHGPKSPKMHFPVEKQVVNPVLPPTPVIHKPQLPEPHEPIMPVKIEPLRRVIVDMDDDDDEDDVSREDTPEPRLIIDDEAQARHEKESRMADLDDCINEVIKRAQNEMESENKESERNVDDAIDSVIRSSKKLEPRDVYDFTDSSDGGDSLPKTPKTPEPTISSPPPKIKKEKTKSPEIIATTTTTTTATPENPKKKKEKTKTPKRKPVKDKPKPSALNFHKFGRSGSQVKRAPSPTFDDSDSSDIVSLPSPGPSTPSQNSPASRGNFNQFSPLGNSFLSPFGPNKFGGMGFPSSSGPFSPLRPLPSNPFPTPPLFVQPKFESPTSQAQPMNLALPSGSSSKEKNQDRKHSTNEGSSKKPSKNVDEVDNKPSKNVKEHKKKPEKKEKVKKKNTKEKAKEKSKKFVPPSPPSPPPAPKTPPPPPQPPPPPPPPPVVIPEAKKSSPVEKKAPKPPKTKAEKKAKPPKVEKEKSKKSKEKEEKIKDDPSSVPKITLKLGSNTPHSSGSTKIVIKTSGKDSRSCSPAKEIPPSPEPSPSPPPPPVSRIKSPPPAAPPPPQRGAAAAAAAATASAVSGGGGGGGGSGSRGRQGGRGRGSTKRAALPTPCIVTTKTLGTIMDESGNKIWICPACTRPDDGSPMIGCDECDDWYHWVCVGIVVPPKEEEEWFCSRCISKKQSFGTKKRHKKHKKDK